MKNYQLTYFEKLIRQVLPPQIRKHLQPDKNSFSRIIAAMKDEKCKITSGIGNQLCDLEEESKMEWYIQLHQQRLILLMDLVATYLPQNELKYIDQPSLEPTWNNLYKTIYRQLMELLTFLEQEYTKYLDIDSKIPISYLFRAQEYFNTQLSTLAEGLSSTGIDDQLIHIVLKPFQEFIAATYQGAFITYQRLFYLNELLKQLTSFLTASSPDTDAHEQLQDLLVYLNFNAVYYLKYFTAAIAMEIEELPAIHLRLNRLIWLQKRINQMPVKTGFAYSKLHEGLQQQLQQWLSDEISYHKEKEQISGTGMLPEELSQWLGFKVLTLFSVSQLAHFVKLLCDGGIFVNKNKKELMAFFSFFFTSTRQDNIAAGSLLNNFYEKNAGVSKSVRDILMDLVNRSLKGITVITHFLLYLFK